MSHLPEFGDDIDIYSPGIILPYHDAPEDEPEDQILVDSGILPHLIDAAKNTLVSPNWEQELAAIGNEDEPILPAPAKTGWMAPLHIESDAITIDNTIHNLTQFTRLIVSELASAGVHPNLCESVEYQIHQLWSNTLRTVSNA